MTSDITTTQTPGGWSALLVHRLGEFTGTGLTERAAVLSALRKFNDERYAQIRARFAHRFPEIFQRKSA